MEKKRDLYTATSKWQKAFNRIVIVSDSAHALGSTYKGQPAGSIADFTSFSFHAVKNFTTAEGGSATWKANPAIDDEEMYKEFQILSLHGQTKDALAKMQLVHGIRYRYTSLQVQYDGYHGFDWFGTIGPLPSFATTS